MYSGLRPSYIRIYESTVPCAFSMTECLQLKKGSPCAGGAKFKFWCHKHFKIETTGNNPLIYCKKSSCPLTTKEDIYDTIKKCHQRVGHSRRNETWDEARKNYAWTFREAVGSSFKPVQIAVSGCQ